MPSRILPEKPDSEGNVLFRIENDDLHEGGADVRLVRVAPQIVDPSLFGKSQLPANSQAYEVETNNPMSNAHVLHIPAEKKIVVRTSKGQITEYSGSLSESILEAYNDKAFCP
jgi:hypothetical protein